MQAEPAIIQFVCFKTPLPKIAFEPVWTPFANSYIAEGLHRIVLRERSGDSILGEAPAYISQNRWPSASFAQVLATGKIGEGGGWPVQATQGGSFRAPDVTDLPASQDQDTIVALLKLRGGNVNAKQAIEQAVSTMGVQYAIYAEKTNAPSRFDAVVEVMATERDGASQAQKLSQALAEVIDAAESTVGVYRLVSILPRS